MADRQVTTTAERYDEKRQHHGQGQHGHQNSSMTALYASLAGVAVGGPLLGMMGLTFLASATLLIISSPLFIIFCPLLFCAAVVLLAVMAGFTASAAMALAGISTLAWIFQSFRRKGAPVEFGGIAPEKVVVYTAGERVKEQGKDSAGYLQQKAAQDNPFENKAVRC